MKWHLGALCFLLFLAAVPKSGDTAEVSAVRVGALVDPATGTVTRNVVILIQEGRIQSVGQQVDIPDGTQIVDLSDKFVLPGLIDAHTHLLARIDPRWDLGDFWIMAMQRRPGWRAILGTRHAQEMLRAGFTTVRDMGNAGDYLDVDLAKAIAAGFVEGPTIIPSGRIIAPYGGQFWDTPADSSMIQNSEYLFADSRDELRRAVRENIYWGALVIKLVVDGQKYQYTTDDIRFVVEEAAAAGLKVAAHVQTQKGARAAIEAGVASIEHGWVLTDEDLALARKKGVVLVSTDFTVNALIANGMTPEQAREVNGRRIERLRRTWQAGVTVVFGTDIMTNLRQSRGLQALEYIDSFVAAGIPAPAILRAMTTDAANLLGVAGDRGAISPGKAADLIAVDENPLEQISTLKSVRQVIRSGKVVAN